LSTGRTRLRASQAPDTHSIPRCINRVLGFDTRQHPRTPRHTTLEDGPEKHSRTDRRNTSLGSTGSSSLFRPRTVRSITSGATRVSRCARGSAQSGAASSAFRPSGADVTGDAARPAPRPEDITDASVFLASLATPFGPGGRRFLIWGHAFRFHRAMAGSSRSTARRSVFSAPAQAGQDFPHVRRMIEGARGLRRHDCPQQPRRVRHRDIAVVRRGLPLPDGQALLGFTGWST
jgi:hypothetical protein